MEDYLTIAILNNVLDSETLLKYDDTCTTAKIKIAKAEPFFEAWIYPIILGTIIDNPCSMLTVRLSGKVVHAKRSEKKPPQDKAPVTLLLLKMASLHISYCVM